MPKTAFQKAEVRYKIQTRVSKELTPAKSNQAKHIFLEPISGAQLFFSSQSQWSISSILVVWSRDELESRIKNELIARCKRKRMVYAKDYYIFISWLPEGSRSYAISVTVDHKFWPDLTCVIGRDND